MLKISDNVYAFRWGEVEQFLLQLLIALDVFKANFSTQPEHIFHDHQYYLVVIQAQQNPLKLAFRVARP